VSAEASGGDATTAGLLSDNYMSLSRRRGIIHGIDRGQQGSLTQIVQLEGMDINPYRYIAPFHSYEFATHVLASSATLILLPMAWLTSEPPSTLQTDPELPDTATMQYWQLRLQPLLEDNGGDREIVVVACNRSGSEGRARYAGTSLIMGLQSGAIRRYGVLGRGVEDLLVVDTQAQVTTPKVT
jgi:hypothetical protein